MRAWRPLPLLLALGLCAMQGSAESEGQARMSGRVVDAEDNPVEGVELILVPTDYRGFRVSGRTDEQGRYRFDSVGAGRYRVRVHGGERIVHRIEAAAVDGTQAAWELAGPVDPRNLLEISIEAGHAVRFDVVMITPEESGSAALQEGYLTQLDRIARLVQQGKCDEAVPRLEDHLAGFPYKARAHYLMGFCQASLGRSEEATGALRRALELREGMPGAALLLGQVLGRMGKVDEAASWLRREIEAGEDPQLKVQAWIELGVLHRDNQRTTEAIEAFEQVIGLAPDRPEPYAELAELYIEADQPEKAEEILVAARQAGPVDIESLLNIGIASFNDKNYARASATFRRAIELAGSDEERAMAYALLGRCQLGEKKTQEAVASLKKSLELDPDGRLAEECRRILKKMGKS